MRVGLVCPYDLSKPGGVQAQVLGLRRALEALGDESLVIGPGLPPDVPGHDLGGTVGIRANGSVAPISVDPRVRGAIVAASRDVDLLHVHEPLMPTVGFAALRAGPPVVATFHAAAAGMGRVLYSLLGRGLGRVLGRNVKRVTAVSTVAGAALPGRLDPIIVPNGVDVAALAAGRADRGMRVSFLGRDEPRKGLDVLLKAWPEVKHRVPEAELVVMGADRQHPGVEWLGVVDESTKVRVLGSSAIYVAPNLGGESFGVTLVEAMAAGAALVASDLEAFMAVGGDAPRYFETGESSALSGLLIDLLLDPGTLEEMSRLGVERAARFDWGAVASRYREIYDEAAS